MGLFDRIKATADAERELAKAKMQIDAAKLLSPDPPAAKQPKCRQRPYRGWRFWHLSPEGMLLSLNAGNFSGGALFGQQQSALQQYSNMLGQQLYPGQVIPGASPSQGAASSLLRQPLGQANLTRPTSPAEAELPAWTGPVSRSGIEPSEWNTAGLYAWWGGTNSTNWNESWGAVGWVEGYGVVAEHEKGFRASHCLVLRLYIQPQRDREMAKKLADRYDCPCVVVYSHDQVLELAQGAFRESR